MLIPATIGLILFHYFPMWGMIIAFQNFKPLLGLTQSQFVGMANFQRMLELPSTWPIVRNTLVIALGKIVFGQMAAVILALLMNEVMELWFKRIIQTLTYLLHFLSWVIFGGILLDILVRQGMVSQLLGVFGIPPVGFLTDARIFPLTAIFTSIWKEFGFSAIIYLAALTSISPTLYEAASVDGANRWQRLRHITIPGIAGTIVLMACLSLGNVLNAGFEQILILQNAQVLSTGEIIDTFVYKVGLINYQYSLATAVGLLKGIVSFILITLSYYLADRLANYRIF
jgi:putative aldouronate transport system permease protein